MKVEKTDIEGLLVIEPRTFRDERGFFLESWQRERYADAGIDVDFVQDNHSHNEGGALCGMHFTVNAPQAQLVYVSSGEIFDVAVDLRAGSPTFGRWYGIILGIDTPRQMFLPAGFAHGFCVTGTHADVHYKVTHSYDPGDEGGINWRDPDIAIDWPNNNPTVKNRDAEFANLSSLAPDELPQVQFNGDLSNTTA